MKELTEPEFPPFDGVEPPPWLDEEAAGLSFAEEVRIEVPDLTPAFAAGGAVARALGERYRHR
jgi:hypothetical protein